MTTKALIPNRIIPTKQPALLLAPNQYTRSYQDQVNNILRMYFSQIDNVTGNLFTNTGGGFLGFPNIAAQYKYSSGDPVLPDTSGNQFAAADNTPTIVQWNFADSLNGFTLNANSSATANVSGVYKIDYSLQFANTDSQIHEAYVWLKIKLKDSLTFEDVPGSTSKFSVPNKHGSINGYLVAYSSVVFSLDAGDSLALYWAASVASGSTTGSPGPVPAAPDGIFMEAYPAVTSPFPHPSLPSAIGSITFVSSKPA